ncbi:TlpA family protein disulfide reductase [Nocardia yunnanensis]|uniref:TlpA family protein disulfide reductase n=1 Tax=Nocardia yunnanensis TaxID=2382165 RepID=A0A386Z9H1_9NOCA|nr:TlpA disulfide reductase family protein [Nocardia yunnanensis]AYF73139.1 TlpA family protein disulfide reductase [Nocardia yunnanensis]
MSADAATGKTWWRWALAAVIVVVAAAVALWPQLSKDSAKDAATGSATAPPSEPAVAEADRAGAALTACPQPSGAPVGDSPLRGITLNCLADGKPVDLVAALAGKPALLNLWAYWCAPCAEELPLLQQFSRQAGDALTVLTVHSDQGTAKALSRLTALGVHLPGVQDPDGKVRTAVHAPAVLPISVLLRADGTVAKVVVRPFTSVEDISTTVAAELGVRA